MAREQQQQTEGKDVRSEGAGGEGGAGMQRAESEKSNLPAGRAGGGGALARAGYSSPFTMMSRLMDEMDRAFSSFGVGVPSLFRPFAEPFRGLETAVWSPEIETFERDGRLVVRADLPGLRQEDVKVEVCGDELVIAGERTEDKEETKGGRRYSERRYGSFERRFTLPEGCDPESVDASFDNGVLEVSFAAPEQPKPKSRKVEIKSGTGQAQKKGEGGGEPVH